ncbi:MAG: prolyl oligopeptidase family serine peptidase [Planctomycetaceae bacterium]|nr:prolyl oligopeptidase family serine peptidase [Planctomycetaceae bacterium]
MNDCRCARLVMMLWLALGTTAWSPVSAEDAKVPFPPMRLLKTADGTHFGLFSEKPAAPAATLFIFATGIDEMGNDPTRYYTVTGRELAKDGWVYVVLDPPCHGYDRKEGEPAALMGWAHRVKAGQDLMEPFVKRCVAVLDHLIAEGYTDPDRVAASGTSRGGFCALHFAAGDPRVRAVTGVSPVTNPLALSEFKGVTDEQAKSININSLTDRLAGRTVWLSIGNHDQRVSTDDCVGLARKLVAATRRLKPELKVVPVELIVGPSAGHSAIDDAYKLEAQFLRKTFQR